jgi:branched-chain amino acid transport system substrate-binding protein
VFTYGYYTATAALIKGLEAVQGDVSDQKKLQDALRQVTLTGEEAPVGRRQARRQPPGVSDVYVKKIVADKTGDKVPDVQTIRRIPDVEQTFGGAFTPDSPELSRDTPECKKGSQPGLGRQGRRGLRILGH